MTINNLKTHMGWTIVVLGALLIGSLSVSWSTLKEIPTIVSIALGLSSLVVAFVAIVQALTGNSTLQSSLSKIEIAAQQALDATRSVEAAADTLSTRVAIFEGLPPSIDAIGKKIDEFALSASQSAVPANSKLSDEGNHSHGVRTSLVEMYNTGTNGSTIALYLISVAHKLGKSFDTTDIFENKFLAGIANGYIVALKSAGLVGIDYVKGASMVRNMDQQERDKIIAAAQADKSEFVAENIARIDSFFAAPTEPKESSEKP